MPLGDSLREEWRERARSGPLCPMMDLTEDGLVLGAGTILAKRRTNRAGMPELALDGAEERILALLAVAYGKAVGPSVLGNIRRASAAWRNGETALALIPLARSRLPKLPDEENAPFRLFAADRVLAAGLAPRELLKACGLDTGPLDLLKAGYNPEEPRVPAGNPDGGQWTYGEAGGAEPESSARPQIPITPVNFTPAKPIKFTHVHELPHDAVAVVPPGGKPIEDRHSLTGKLMAPPYADFRQVYTAGKAIADLPWSKQYPLGRAAIAQGGTYDFQRDVPHLKFYDAYVHAANYAVGVYMAGAGHSLPATLLLAKYYAWRHSSNYDAQDQEDWITRGWIDANSGRWK